VNLLDLQREHKEWVEHNFPRNEPYMPLLGIMEEVGELSHAHLKFDQEIRGYTRSRWEAEAEDAIGDIIIYLASYCNANFLNLEECLDRTWDRVKQRDWIADPQKGGEG